ncbi:MAG TPA: short-chain dehydrogenase, partial [Paenibacillaceae bacterium]|nr:short-chain dehydrogenase [Paenibacillaceae bacterium]
MKLVIITGTSAGLGQSFFRQMSSRCDGLMSISRRILPEQKVLAKENGKELFLLQRDFT